MNKDVTAFVSLFALKHRETDIISHIVLANTFGDAKIQYQEDFNYFVENNPLDPNVEVVKEYYSKCDIILLCNINILGGSVLPIGEIMVQDISQVCEVNLDE